MNNPLLSVETLRWKKARFRWALVLCGLLAVNASLVVIAVAGYSGALPASADEASDLEITPANEGVAASSNTTSEPVAAPSSESQPAIQTNPSPVIEPADDSQIAVTPSGTESAPPSIASRETLSPVDALLDPTAIVVVNPLDNGGPVNFLFAETVFTLQPGEFVSLAGCEDTQIIYHKGDELEDAACDCPPGIYVFDVSESGWHLSATDPQTAAILPSCRPACLP